MKTAEIAIIFITGSLTLLAFVFFVILIIIEYRKRQVSYITEKLKLEHRYQSEVLQTRIEVQEQSFKYLSEELHDNIAQMLSLAQLKLYKTAGRTTDTVAKAGIETTNELLGKTMQDLRNLSHALNGGLVSKLPLQESLETELSYIHDSDELQTQLSVSGQPYEIGAERKLLMFRIAQEAIGNAIKHGKAKRIDIRLDYRPGTIVMQVADNGTGFDTRLLTGLNGLGLHNMQVRAQMLGTLDVASEPGKGSTITLNVTNHE